MANVYFDMNGEIHLCEQARYDANERLLEKQVNAL